MFSIYGKAGRVFAGSLEDLRRVQGPGALSAGQRVLPVLPKDAGESTAEFVALHQGPAPESSAREAMQAYAHTLRTDGQRHPLTKVRDIMRAPAFTLMDTQTLQHAWEQLAARQVGQAPVVSAQGVLVGLITRSALLDPERLPGPQAHPLAWRAMLAQPVSQVMWTPVPSVWPDTDIRRFARVLLDTGLPGLPVVDDAGRVQAFVSRTDVLRAVVSDPPLDLWS